MIMLNVIPAILARGYGVSFRSVESRIEDDNVELTFPKEQVQGELVLGYDDVSEVVMPMIKIGNEVTVCVAFTVYIPDVGWKHVDLTKLPANLTELQEAVKENTMPIQMLDLVVDMSGYEIINAWEEKK